jgi:hypothetical protein
MSRAPQYEQHQQISSRKGVIDFVGVPQYSQHYQPEDGLQSMYPPQGPYQAGPIYTSAGYSSAGYSSPGYTQQAYQAPVYPQPTPFYSQQAYPQQAYSAPVYTQQAYPYQAYPSQYVSASCTPDPAPASLTEDSLREKINTKIDSIMDTHRAEVLSTQIERLGDKVQRLSRHLEATHVRPDPGPATLEEPERDEELTKRLKRLAAESSKRLKERF